MDIQLLDNNVEAFIRSLNKPTMAKVLRTIDLLERFGRLLGMPHSKHIGNGLFELRVRGTQEVRLLYCFYKNKAVILHGLVKKSSHIARKDYKLALRKKKHIDKI